MGTTTAPAPVRLPRLSWLATALLAALLCLALLAPATDARSSSRRRHRPPSRRRHQPQPPPKGPDADAPAERKLGVQGQDEQEQEAPPAHKPRKLSTIERWRAKRRREAQAAAAPKAGKKAPPRGGKNAKAPAPPAPPPARTPPPAPAPPAAPPAKAPKKARAGVIPHHLRAKQAAKNPPKAVPPSKRRRQRGHGAAPADARNPIEEALSETLCVVKIPTGSAKAAWEARRDLDRAGLGMRYDHGRFLHEIEAYVPATELARLADPGASPLPPGATDRWVVVRNVTRREVAGQGIWTPPPGAAAGAAGGAGLLPVNKNRYHSSGELERVMRAMVRKWPGVASLQSLGRTLRGEVVWGLKVTGHTPEEHGHARARGERNHPGDHWRPVVLFTGALHGDDVVGREMCLWLAEYLCEMYQSSSAVQSLLNRLTIFLVPEPSPDASTIGSRFTTRRIDIDRGFPERVMHRGDPAYPERETEALMQWALHNRPVAAATFVGGGGGPGGAKTIVRYPWNGVGGDMVVNTRRLQRNVYRTGMEMPTPDDRSFRYLARLYAMAHTTMARNDPRLALAPGEGGIEANEAGIVNGARWYPRFGTLQDWLYDHTGALHFDLLISPHLKPLPDRLSMHWEHNRRALLTFLRAVDGEGLRGTVRDAETGAAVPDAVVVVRDMTDHSKRLHPVATDSAAHGAAGVLGERTRGGGHFARYLHPGRYSVWAEAPGYKTSKQQTFMVSQQAPIFDIDITLVAG